MFGRRIAGSAQISQVQGDLTSVPKIVTHIAGNLVGNSAGPKQPPATEPPNVPVTNYRNLAQNTDAATYNRGYQDHSPINFRKVVDASGVQSIQLRNPVAHTTRRRLTYQPAGYLFAQAPRIPGQSRDNFGGFHARGIDPLSYQAVWNDGPGSQPSNPGGPGRIAAPRFTNPMAGT